MKIITTILIILVCICIIGSVIHIHHIDRYDEKKDIIVIENAKIHIITEAYNELYESSGILFPSLQRFELSAYYPYREDYSTINIDKKTITNRNLFIKPFISDNLSYWICDIINNDKVVNSNIASMTSISKDEVTKIKIQYYLSGIKNIKDSINISRYNIDYNTKSLFGKSFYNSNFTIKNIPDISIKYDLPTNDKEISIYLEWLKNLENTKELTDGYGNKLRFKISHHHILICTIMHGGDSANENRIIRTAKAARVAR